jgi:hypothetical protein
MTRLAYRKDGHRWELHEVGNVGFYFTTNNTGKGLTIVYPYRNDRKDILGTLQFSVSGLSDSYAKRKMRKAYISWCRDSREDDYD